MLVSRCGGGRCGAAVAFGALLALAWLAPPVLAGWAGMRRRGPAAGLGGRAVHRGRCAADPGLARAAKRRARRLGVRCAAGAAGDAVRPSRAGSARPPLLHGACLGPAPALACRRAGRSRRGDPGRARPCLGHVRRAELAAALRRVLHLLAAAAWLGGLVPLLVLVAAAPPGVAALASSRFSPLGAGCVLLLAGTALFQACVLSERCRVWSGRATGWSRWPSWPVPRAAGLCRPQPVPADPSARW